MLRTKIAATMQANSWSTLAITAPTAGCGTTTMAVALATGLARQRDTQVTLLDLNLRKPGVARIASEGVHRMLARAGDVGRLGGGAGQAVEIWIVEGWLYFILLGAVVGAVLGIASMFVVSFTLKRYVLYHTYILQAHLLNNRS